MTLLAIEPDSSTTMSVCHLSVFFFQAEDGIRDLTVTGVQTCALPISPPADEFVLGDLREPDLVREVVSGVEEVYQLAADMGGAGYIFTGENDAAVMRSEERRVGKECRSRWSPYH